MRFVHAIIVALVLFKQFQAMLLLELIFKLLLTSLLLLLAFDGTESVLDLLIEICLRLRKVALLMLLLLEGHLQAFL